VISGEWRLAANHQPANPARQTTGIDLPATLPTPPANQQADRPACHLPQSFHRFIVSLTSTGVHFNEMHFISFHFNESAMK